MNRELTLEDVTLNITDGKHGDCKNEDNSGFYFISVKDIADGEINYNNARQITKKDFEDTHKRTKLDVNDILITNSGTIGKMCILKKSPKVYTTTFQKSVAVIKPNTNMVEPDYLYYLLKSKVNELIKTSGGSIQKNLLLKDLRSFKVSIPNKEIQKAVIKILTSIDAKNKINKKINQELEQVAQTLFDYWFAQFDFPDEKGNPYKSSGGEVSYSEELGRDIPNGWKGTPITELGEIIAGGTPKTSCPEYYCEKGIAWITPKDLSNSTDMYISHGEREITEDGLNNSSAKLMPKGSVLLSTRAPIGYLAIALNEVSTNQGFKSIVPKEPYSSEFVYYIIKSNINNIANQASGTTFQEVSKEVLSNFNIICPPEEVLKKYDEIMRPISSKRKVLEQEIKELIELRDFLLPLLMNGQVQIADELYQQDDQLSKMFADLMVAEEEVAATEEK